MDNYHGRTRTNFFKVNNINKFSKTAASVSPALVKFKDTMASILMTRLMNITIWKDF